MGLDKENTASHAIGENFFYKLLLNYICHENFIY
jgi:hypothetical protein